MLLAARGARHGLAAPARPAGVADGRRPELPLFGAADEAVEGAGAGAALPPPARYGHGAGRLQKKLSTAR